MKKINLKTLKLKTGSHSNPNEGLCVMEAVAYFANEPHSDKPKCACPVLTSYMIKLNDLMNDEERKMLKPYIKKLINTRDGNSSKRLEILVHNAYVKITPYTLELAGLKEHADKMRTLKIGDYSAAAMAAKSAAIAAKSASKSAARNASKRVAWTAAAIAAKSDSWSAAVSAAIAAESAVESVAWSAAESVASERKIYWKMALNALNESLKVR